MKIAAYRESWTSAQSEVRTMRVAVVAMSILSLLLTIAVLTKHTVVHMLPPHLTKESWITNDGADDEVLVQWGISIAELFGNVTPTTAPTLKNSIATMLTPHAYHALLDAVDVQAKQIAEERVTVQFTPTGAKRDPRTGHVLVTGEQTTTGVQGTSSRDLRTYDITLVVMNYRVLIDDIETYKGEPKNAGPGA